MTQTYTSSATSVNKTKLPAVYRRASGLFTARSPFVMDYGCGKYTDHISEFLKGYGKVLYPYDPYNQSKAVNEHTLQFLNWAGAMQYEVDVVCSNVLNVINSDDEVEKIALIINAIVQITGGKAFITVYEGDRSGIGRRTGKDQYQRNEKLRSYLRFFPTGKIEHGMIVIRKEC